MYNKLNNRPLSIQRVLGLILGLSVCASSLFAQRDLTVSLTSVRQGAATFSTVNGGFFAPIDFVSNVKTTERLPPVNVGDATYLKYSVFISTDSIVSADDQLLETRFDISVQNNLTQGLSSVLEVINGIYQSGIYSTYDSRPNGRYFVYVKIDSDNYYAETNENNNISNIVGVDLYALFCQSRGTTPWNNWIQNVSVGTLNNASDKGSDLGVFNAGYSNFYNKTPATFAKGQSYPFTITPGVGYVGQPNGGLFFRVWIDANGDGIFSDNEQVLEKTSANIPVSQTITIPVTAKSGITGMRVSMKAATYAYSCESFVLGEVEDYLVNLTGANVAPDLTVSNVIAPAFVRINETLNFTYRVKNIGTAVGVRGFITAMTSVGIFSNPDNGTSFGLGSTQKLSDYPIGFDSLVNFSSVIPQNIPVGNYFLQIEVDPDLNIAESNEANNKIRIPFEVRAATTDNQKLIVTAVAGSNRVQPNGVLSVNVTIKNNATVLSVADSLYIASWVATGAGAGTFYSTPYSRNKIAIPAIAANQSVTIPASFTMPATLSSNVYAVASREAVLLEPYFITKAVAEFNNSGSPVGSATANAVSYNYPILPASTADLVLTGSQINTTWDSANPAINTRLRVTNNGPNAANNITVQINSLAARFGNPLIPAIVEYTLTSGGGTYERRSVDIFNSISIEYYGWKIPNIPAGASIEATFRGRIATEFGAPQTSTSFYKDLTIKPKILYADALDNNKANDSISGGFTYRFVPTTPTTNLPDLTITNLVPSNPNVIQGQNLNFTFDGKNIGTGAATGNFTIKSYLSTDQVIDASDYQNGTIPTANYAVGANITQIAGAVSVTTAIPAGNYYLLLKIDADNVIAESTENNNLVAALVVVVPVQSGTNYCVSKGNLPWNEWIAGVQFANINNASQKEGYGNFTNLTANVTKGQSYPLSITQGFSWAADPSNATQQWSVWIDYNQNKIFDAVELVATGTRTTATANISIPTSALTGATRMRISFKTIGAPTACETFDRGEVEDYTVNIAAGTGGGAAKLVISNVTGPASAVPGNQITLAVTVTNTGGVATVPTKLFYAQVPTSAEPLALTDNTATVAPLLPNETRVVNFTLTLKNPIYPPNASYLSGFSSPYEFGDYIVVATNEVRPNGTPNYSATDPFFKFNIAPTFPQANISVSVVPNKTTLRRNETWNAVYTIKNNSTTLIKQVFFNLGTFQRLSRNFISPNFEVASVGTEPANSFLKRTVGEVDKIGLEMFDLAAGESRSITLDFSRILTPLDQGSNRPQDTTATGILPFPFVNTASNVVNTNTTVGAPINIFVGSPVVVGNQPDLTLQNLTVPTPSVQQGQILNFKVDAKNIGTAAATGNFTIKSYLSTDNVLSANDYADGSVPTGNYAAGFSFPQIPAAMTVRNTLAAGQYYLILKIDADNQVTEGNENNNVIVSTGLITVTAPTTGGGGSDIALSISATPSVYRAYTTQNVKITATNSGTTAFTNVKIKFTKPANTVSGGTKIASVGTFQDFCPGGIECSEWTIPTLAGGATATLDAPIFILAPTGAITATAALLSSTPTDNTTANNTASLTLNPAVAPIAAPLIAYRPTQLIPIVIQKVNPTLAENEITVELESLIEKTVDFGISNSMGQTVLIQQILIEKGLNKIGFDVSQLPQGLYFIQTSVGKGRNVPTKFVKL